MLITQNAAWAATWISWSQGNCALVVEFLLLGCPIREGFESGVLYWPSLLRTRYTGLLRA